MTRQTFQPDFEQLLSVLANRRPGRPVLYEFAIGAHVLSRWTERERPAPDDHAGTLRYLLDAYAAGGYDYAPAAATPPVGARTGARRKEKSLSLNDGAVITDRRSYEEYAWPDPGCADFSALESVTPELPGGMRIVARNMGSILETAVKMFGFETLCALLFEDTDLVEEVFRQIGERAVRYVELVVEHDAVGAINPSDDWGFGQQTILSPDDLRRFVFPWHRRMVEAAHAAGKPAILHSCGNVEAVMPDVIEIGYDAKHSFEDKIVPVEESYGTWGSSIAILGGIDVDFLARGSEPDIAARSRAMLDLADERGGYALGSGNSIPDYVPAERFLAMRNVAIAARVAG